MLAWLWNISAWHFIIALIPLAAIQHAFAVHARLLKEQEASTQLMEQQRQIHEATTILLSATDIHTQLDTMMRYIMGMFPVSHASVVLWGEGEEIEQVVSRGVCVPALPLAEWNDKLRRVCETRRLVQLDHEFVRQAMGGQPVLIVPLVTPDDVVGCTVLVTNPSFSVDEQAERLIKTFAAQAALAIYQARLITKLKSSQVRVVQSERLAAIGTLAAGVAHEFNNLLAGISGIAQLALLDDDADQREALDTVAKSAQNGGSITRGLLTFARHLEPKREPADLRNAIDPVLSMLQAEFRRMNIKVERRIQPVAPLLCDIGTLAQVMLNLVTNAIDAMHATGGTLIIELAEDIDHVRLVVTDTGSGIPVHVRDRIFEPFVSTKMSNDGKLHGGSGHRRRTRDQHDNSAAAHHNLR
jgi:signal transduction histidine kinase